MKRTPGKPTASELCVGDRCVEGCVPDAAATVSLAVAAANFFFGRSLTARQLPARGAKRRTPTTNPLFVAPAPDLFPRGSCPPHTRRHVARRAAASELAERDCR